MDEVFNALVPLITKDRRANITGTTTSTHAPSSGNRKATSTHVEAPHVLMAGHVQRKEDVLRANVNQALMVQNAKSTHVEAIHVHMAGHVQRMEDILCANVSQASMVQNAKLLGVHQTHVRTVVIVILMETAFTASVRRIFVVTRVRVSFDPCFFIPCHKPSKCVSTGHPNKGNGSWSAHCECDGYHKGDLCESEDNMCQLTDRPDCISECSAAEDGAYILCENCRKYAVCNGGIKTEKSCPDKPFWGFNKETRQCQYKSPDCFECSDPCKHSPCQGGGTCIPYIARYECTCAEERAGNLCQFDKSQCTPNPCQNGGECVVDGTYNATLHYVVYWECFCQMGYSGDTCEQKEDDLQKTHYLTTS
ncbi:hypothetical protein LSAT2_032013 [Lamellibrachia satsuma]|nr:hypothetical protein LSAT2_032013 [Lamellibrachia satsuma]